MKTFLIAGFLITITQQFAWAQKCEKYYSLSRASGMTRQEAIEKAKPLCIRDHSLQIADCENHRGTPYYSTPFTCSLYYTTDTEGPGPWTAYYQKDNPVTCCFN